VCAFTFLFGSFVGKTSCGHHFILLERDFKVHQRQRPKAKGKKAPTKLFGISAALV
jgi:hypothetical protein